MKNMEVHRQQAKYISKHDLTKKIYIYIHIRINNVDKLKLTGSHKQYMYEVFLKSV